MDFTIGDRQKHWRDRVAAFMARHVYPPVPTFTEQMNVAPEKRWQVVLVLEELKQIARADGLWNLFLPPSPSHDTPQYKGAGLSGDEASADDLPHVEVAAADRHIARGKVFLGGLSYRLAGAADAIGDPFGVLFGGAVLAFVDDKRAHSSLAVVTPQQWHEGGYAELRAVYHVPGSRLAVTSATSPTSSPSLSNQGNEVGRSCR